MTYKLNVIFLMTLSFLATSNRAFADESEYNRAVASHDWDTLHRYGTFKDNDDYLKYLQSQKSDGEKTYDWVEEHGVANRPLGALELGAGLYSAKKMTAPFVKYGLLDKVKLLGGRVAQESADATGAAIDGTIQEIKGNTLRAKVLRGTLRASVPPAKMITSLPGAALDLVTIPLMIAGAGATVFGIIDGGARLTVCQSFFDQVRDAHIRPCSKSIFMSDNDQPKAQSSLSPVIQPSGPGSPELADSKSGN